jgi:MATE family multidrug resistance protein
MTPMPAQEKHTWLGVELRALLKLALPIAAAQAGQTLMGLVDVAVVGKLGARPLGAIGLANSIFFFVGIIGLGTVMGLDPLTSQALGAGDRPRARRLLWQGTWLGLICSAILMSVLAFAPLVLEPMQVPHETATLTSTCLVVRLLSMPGLLLFAVMRSYLQAYGKTRPMVLSMIAANLFNLGADVLLVYGGAHLPGWTGPLRQLPAMGATGAALATTLGTYLQLGIVAWAAAGHEHVVLPKGSRRPVRADILRAARVGLPIGLQMGAEVGVFALVTVLAARLGDASLAAHQLALTLASCSFSIALGVGNAGSVRVGWAIGQGQPIAVRRAGLVAFGTGMAVMGTSASAFLLAPHWLPHLFPAQAEVVAVAAPLLGVAAVFQISDGVQGVGAGVLRGAGDTMFPFLANVAGHYAIGLPIAVWLGLRLHGGIVGLWWGLCCGLTVVAVALISRFLWLSARPIAPLERHPGAH